MALRNVATITSTVKNGEEIFRHPPCILLEQNLVAKAASVSLLDQLQASANLSKPE